MENGSNWARLEKLGLLRVGRNCQISDHVIFEFSDILGKQRPIVISDNCRISAACVIYGGCSILESVVVEEHSVIGKPEFGYAVGNSYEGSGSGSEIMQGSIVRGGAVIYSGCRLGQNSTIGHNAVVRSNVSIGDNSQLGQFVSVERQSTIGNFVRCSPHCHITSSVVMEDRTFFGAGVITINDKEMIWRMEGTCPELVPPYFEYGAKLGSGVVVAAGVRIGKQALVGSGSVVTKDIPPYSVAYGVPAHIRGKVEH